MQDNFIVVHSDLNIKIGLYHTDYTAIPAILGTSDVEYIKHTLMRFINQNLPYDYQYSFYDKHGNLVVVKLMPINNRLLFGVLLDDSGQMMEDIAILDAKDAKEILTKL
jgi:hypothetical protein